VSWASTENDVDAAFYRRFAAIPVALLTVSVPGLPCVSIDTYAGQKQAIKHLAESHAYARARFQAYRDALAEAGLDLDPALVSGPGRWTADWGAEAVAAFLDSGRLRPGADFQALACANDNIAIGAADELKRRGTRIPEQVAVVGYNNSAEAVYNNPPLATERKTGAGQALGLDLMTALEPAPSPPAAIPSRSAPACRPAYSPPASERTRWSCPSS
jgi:LacI family transcriptional regulator